MNKDPITYTDAAFEGAFKEMMRDVHNTAKEKGWWDGGERNTGELIALCHSELSEMVEALRHGNPPDDKIPEFDGAVAEAADCIIRLMDMCERAGWPLEKAIVAKARFNSTRTQKHGGKKF